MLVEQGGALDIDGEQWSSGSEHTATLSNSSGRAVAALVSTGVLLLGLVAISFGGQSRTSRSSLSTGFEGLLQASSESERYPAKGCFRSHTKYDPLDMPGTTRLKYDTIEKCQQRCRETDGCIGISYWMDWGCHLAGANAKLVDADTEALSGPKTCETKVCFQHGVVYEPMDIVGRGRKHTDSAAACHAYCRGMQDCKTFVWWPDGGCHVQNEHARPKVGSVAAHVISGPSDCPLVPTTATQTTTITTTTEEPTVTTEKPTIPEPATEPATEEPTTTTEEPTTTEPTTSSTTYPPTPAPMPFGCRKGVSVYLTSHRSQKLTDRMPCLHAPHLCAHQGHWDEWILSHAGDGSYFITSPSDKHLQLTDNHHILKLSGNKGSSESWNILDAGSGDVFLQSHRGMFIQDAHGSLMMTPNADNWEKWTITAVDGEPACRFPSTNLFCFVVMRSWGHELDLMKNQHSKGAGIFDCDTSMIFSDANLDISSDPDDYYSTTLIEHDILQHDVGVHENKHLFIKVWEHILHDGRYSTADWVVKTDPDTVFMAPRLHARLGGSSHGRSHATFFANCRHEMYGALEVFSSKAVDIYFNGKDHCKTHIHLSDAMWEERYLTHCLQLLHVTINPWRNLDLLSDPYCDHTISEPDCAGTAVAMHKLDTIEKWDACYNIAHHHEDGHD